MLPLLVLGRTNRLTERSIFVYADTTDAGPDQTARRKNIKSAVANLDCFFYLDCNCVLHQFHLVVRESLLLTDEFLKKLKETHPQVSAGFEAYVSSLAKCCNFWRSHVTDFISAWESIHGFGKRTRRTEPHPVQYRRFPLAVKLAIA